MNREVLAQEWRERLEDYALSEMTVQEWCEFNRVTPYQYYYWRRRLAAPAAQNAGNGGWQAVNIVDTVSPPTTKPSLSLRIAGADIEVEPGFDPNLLRAVVAALATPPC